MSLPIPDAALTATVPNLVFARPVFQHVMEVVLSTDRGDFVRDDIGEEILLHLELCEDDLELCPILAREGAEEVWLVLSSLPEEPRITIEEVDLRQSVCRHSRIEYLCEVCNPIRE